jgi:nucleotide-binding universal stress UspA family protein
MSTIIVGVDGTERAEDALAFAARLAEAVDAHVTVTRAYTCADRDGSVGARAQLRDEAVAEAAAMRDKLELDPDRSSLCVTADPSPAKALTEIAHAKHASLLVVGSTHTGRVGRVLPGSTGERLLNGAPCSVAVVPKSYRTHGEAPIRTIGVGVDGSEESAAAVTAAAALARALGAELELIGAVSYDSIAPAYLGAGASVAELRDDLEQAVQQSLDDAAASVGDDLPVRDVRLTGEPGDVLTARSAELDLLVLGSRGYGPLRSVLVGGVSGRVLRGAHCPTVIVPRGIEAPLATLFDERTAAA